MLKSGTKVVGGVNARKAGTTVTHTGPDGADVELPVFGTVKEAMAETGADVSVAFVPPAFTKDACLEAIDAGIGLLVVITEGVPVQDTAEVWAYLDGPGNRRHPDDRAELPRHHHARARRWPASRRPPSPARARSAWSRSRAR